MRAFVTHHIEWLRVINDQGKRDQFCKVTSIENKAFGDGMRTTRERLARVTIRSGERVNFLEGGIFETLSGERWRLA